MRLTAQMAEKLDLESKAYWQKQHEKSVEARRALEQRWRYLRAISRVAKLEEGKEASPSCLGVPLGPGLDFEASQPRDSN